MKRRKFMQTAAISLTAAAVMPSTVVAGHDKEHCNTPKVGAGGLFYTKDKPGRWQKKVGSHLPSAEVIKDGDAIKVKVLTSHPMDGYKHYIVKHMLLDDNFNFIAEHMFDPTKDAVPMSEFELGQYSGRLHLVSMCNKHDVWLNHVDI